MNKKQYIIRIFSFFLTFLISLPVTAEEIRFKLTEDSAYDMLLKAYCHSAKCDTFEYSGNGPKTWTPPFFLFDRILLADAYGAFAVNPWTGNVWDLWACKEISTRASRKAQIKLRNLFTQSELPEYERLKAIHPTCLN